MIFSAFKNDDNKPFRHHWKHEVCLSSNASRVLISHKDKNPFTKIGVIEMSRKTDDDGKRIYQSHIGPFVPSYNGLTQRYEYLVHLTPSGGADIITLYISHKSWWPKFTFSGCPYDFDFRIMQ